MDIEKKKAGEGRKLGNTLIHIGRFISFFAAVFFIVMLFSEGAAREITSSESASTQLILLAALAIIGYILSYWKAKYAGILLVVVALAFMVHAFYYLNNGQISLWLITGMPQLIAGSLLLLGYRIKKLNRIQSV
jgi:uncharacterized membrane protein AbrB (regulator of aidB expression)